MNYADALKRLREYNSCTQKDMAEVLKTSQQQWSLYENGLRELKTTQIIELAKKFNISADYILGLTDEKRPYPRAK